MPKLDGSKTQGNLKEAFAGRARRTAGTSTSRRRPTWRGIPTWRRCSVRWPRVRPGHAFGHFDFLAEVGDPVTGEPVGPTTDNLKSAIAGETYEYTEMYPGFAQDRA